MEGETVSPCKTDEFGNYLFNSLEAGDYLVAFAGEALSEYLGTAPYQKHGIAKEKNSDGTELTGTEGLDKEFLYRISCTAEEPDITLKTVGDIADGGSFTDNVSDMDLGLVKGASLRVKKRVETADGKMPELSNEPIDPAYRFLIRVTDVTDQAGKYEYAAFSLPHDGTSPDIELEDFSDGGIRKFEIRETAPMEYSLVKAAAERTDESGKKTITKLEAGEVLTVRPGDDITVTLSNEPRHSGYFHHTSALTNEKKAGESGFKKDENADYKENHGNEGSQPKRNTRVNFAAAAEDRGRPKSQRGKEGGDEQDD